MLRNRFIVLEGADGAGKTSIRKHIFGTMRAMGVEVLTIIQTSWLVPEFTEIITNARFHGMSYPAAEITRAYVGDKAALTNRVITPHLAERHVLGDRFVISDVVYHQVLWAIPPEDTFRAYVDSDVRMPDLTVFIDTHPDVSLARLRARGPDRQNRWDTPQTQYAVYDLYQKILFGGEFPTLSPVIRIDNSGAIDRSFAAADRVVTAWLEHERSRPGR